MLLMSELASFVEQNLGGAAFLPLPSATLMLGFDDHQVYCDGYTSIRVAEAKPTVLPSLFIRFTFNHPFSLPAR